MSSAKITLATIFWTMTAVGSWHYAPDRQGFFSLLPIVSAQNSTDTSTTTESASSSLYPNPQLTPGAVLTTNATKVCVSGYSRAVRHVTQAMKKQVFQNYGLDYPQPRGAYEVDHFIALELGGSNDISNLWPEPANPTPGFHEKDDVENYLHKQVCSGAISIEEAQDAIRTDWYAVYQKMNGGDTALMRLPVPRQPAFAGPVTLYPDPDLTPGDILTADAQKVCAPHYATNARNVATAAKNQVYKEYGLTFPQPRGSYELDHFIPLELGGSNDVSNLWPERAQPQPGFHEKDRVENYLHKQVCSKKMTLQDAQEAIKKDWYTIYKSLPRR